MASRHDADALPSNSMFRRWLNSERRQKRANGSPKMSFGDVRRSEESEGGLESHKTQRSQFLRLFGRRESISPRTLLESLPEPASKSPPALPTELWVHILHLAASPSHPFLSSSIITPSTSISFLEYPHSHSHLIPAYWESMRFKCQLTLVSKFWHAVAQEVLFEFVWITKAKEAELLSDLLAHKALRGLESLDSKGRQCAVRSPSFDIRLSDETNFDYNSNGVYTYAYDSRAVGRHIRRVHVETASLDRCSPGALLAILQYAPLLQIFSDYRSIRRNPNFQITSTASASTLALSSNAPATPSSTHICSVINDEAADHKVLSALLTHPHRNTALHRLSWTNYNYEPRDYEAGVRFYLRVVGPKLQMASAHLDFLELTLCAKDLGGMGGGGTRGFLDTFLNPPTRHLNANHLTSLSTTLTSSTVTTVTSSSDTATDTLSSSPLHLPALRSLKVTLDNATFHVLSLWTMPELRNLSVVSADFSYAGEGFAQFFGVHGHRIKQLELGHSSCAIEEFWLTGGPNANGGAGAAVSAGTGWTFGSTRVPLAEWCPNLAQFICSADADWNWQSPDWIAPHVLLPAHPTLSFIGVRDLEKRILEGLERVERVDKEVLARGGGLYPIGLDGNDDGGDAFFTLVEQFGGLVNRDAFPSLLYVRDLSWESALMRRMGKVRVAESGTVQPPVSASSLVLASSPPSSTADCSFRHILSRMRSSGQPGFAPQCIEDPSARHRLSEWELVRKREMQQGRRVLKLWMCVATMCRATGVWLEDCDGVNITPGLLNRVAQEVRI